jgi:hypothetical protein
MTKGNSTVSKRRRRKPGDHYERFIMLPHYMLRSEVWKTLAPEAKALLIDVWMRHNGSNNGEISYSVREASQIGLSRSVAARMFKVLTDRGFLRIARNSAFSLKTKEARLWHLTTEPLRDERPTKDFMRWTQHANATTKFKPQSLPENTQSRIRDHQPNNETKLSVSVPPMGLHAFENDASQSLGRDTSIIPGGGTPPQLDCATDKPSFDLGTAPDEGDTSTLDTLECLRAEVRDRLQAEGNGAIARRAFRIGVSRPTLSNFLGGRFGINSKALAALRGYVEDEKVADESALIFNGRSPGSADVFGKSEKEISG